MSESYTKRFSEWFAAQTWDSARDETDRRYKERRELQRFYAEVAEIKGVCDRQAAEAAVDRLYECCGYGRPQFVWFDSPLAAVECAVERDVGKTDWSTPTFRQELLDQFITKLLPVAREWRSAPIETLALWVDGRGVAVGVNTLILFEMLSRFRETKNFNKQANIEWLSDESSLPLLNYQRPFDFSFGNGDVQAMFAADSCRVHLSDSRQFEVLREIAEHCGWWRAERDICLMADRPTTVELDARNRPHGRISFADGFCVYAIHGVRVEERIFQRNFSVRDIDRESNAEVRRVMIEMYGVLRYLMDSKAELIHRDEYGELYRKPIQGDEAIVVLKVMNSTPEPDGTYKEYFLRVPPQMRSARQAVAWTFGLTEDQYAPSKET